MKRFWWPWDSFVLHVFVLAAETGRLSLNGLVCSYSHQIPSILPEISCFSHFLLYFLQHPLQMIGRKEGGEKKLESEILSSPDFLLCSIEAIDAPLCNKETFPSGSPVAVHTNEKSPSAWFCIPRVHFLQQATQRLLSLRCGSHVYAFVPHYSGPASADPHLAFKFPQPTS